jgi:mono/diheme cytochrome c family protein
MRAALATQLLRGGQLYTEHCARCHGDAGEGSEDGPSLVGESALPRHAPAGAKRTAELRTAADVLAFTSENMPADDPGALPPDDYLAIVAFALTANGVSLERLMDEDSARAVVLHR